MNEPNTLSLAAIPVEQRFETLVTLLDQIDLRSDQTELKAKINALIETLQQEMIGRRQAEAALRDSEARYRRLLETALEGIWIGDAEGRTIYVNPRGAAILGYSPPEIIGHDAVEFLFPEDIAASRQRSARIRQGESLTYDARLRAKDGTARWLRLATSPIVDKQGLFQGFLVMFADGHEHRLAAERARLYEAERQARAEASTAHQRLARLVETEQQARQAAERAAERAARLQVITAALAEALTPAQVAEIILSQTLPILNALGSTVYLLSDDGQELQLIETTGYPPEVMDRWQRVPAHSHTALADAVRLGRPVLLKSREAAAAAYPEVEFDRPEGGKAWAALPLLVRGRAIGVMGLTFADPQEFSPEEQEFLLTLAGQCAQAIERTDLYAGLAEAHALLDTIFNSAPVGLGFWDRELRFTRLNPALAEMNGLPVEAHLGQTLAEILPDVAGIDQILAMWRQVLETGQPILDVEVNGQTPARPGEQRAWLESWYPVKVGREIIGVGAVVQEVTERKRMEAQLRAALAEKEALVKEVYHRVKNNLQGVYYLVSLQAGHLPDGPARQALLDTQARIRSMTLIHDKLSRSQDVTRLDFADYIRSLAGQLIGSLHSAAGSIQLEVDFDDLAIDPETATTLGIVVNELLINALKHAFPPGLGRPGQIRIELRAVDAQWMRLVIGDNGIGLPPDFDLAATGSLGLQLVTGLIGHLKGQVELHGQGGTTFKIMLPRTP